MPQKAKPASPRYRSARHDDPAVFPPPGESSAWATALKAERRRIGAATVSAVVHTLNEEAALGDALRSLGWVDEVIVIDMRSDDDTVGVATALGAVVVPHERLGFVEGARNFGIEQAQGPWVLVLDADERITENLASELVAITMDDAVDVVALPRVNYLCGRWMRASGWGDEHQIRLFRKGHVTWTDRIHSVPQYHGRYLRLPHRGTNHIVHYNYRDLDAFITRLNRYAGIEAAELLVAGGTTGWDAAVAEARAEFLSRWAPEVDGLQSAALSFGMLLYRLIAHAKAWEQQNWPDLAVPRSGTEALRDLLGSGPVAHGEIIALIKAGRLEDAKAAALRAITTGLDPRLVADLANVALRLGHESDGRTAAEILRLIDTEGTYLIQSDLMPDSSDSEPPEGSLPDARLLQLQLTFLIRRERERHVELDRLLGRVANVESEYQGYRAESDERDARARAHIAALEDELMRAARVRAVAEHELHINVQRNELRVDEVEKQAHELGLLAHERLELIRSLEGHIAEARAAQATTERDYQMVTGSRGWRTLQRLRRLPGARRLSRRPR
jgi:hypothetical protein